MSAAQLADYSLLSYTDDAAAIKEGKVDVGSREDGGMCVRLSNYIALRPNLRSPQS